MSSAFDLSELTKNGRTFSRKELAGFVWQLSIPGIFAQISSILMQYIDAAMVGHLGANPSAAIALVAPATWILGSLTGAFCIGYTVQVAQATGAGSRDKAKHIFWQSIISGIILSLVLIAIAAPISGMLPSWLGASQEIHKDASIYFFIFVFSVPSYLCVHLMSGMLQCSGNMKIPGLLNGAMCLLDVIFNFLFIFIFKMGVKGAALGSACSAFTIAIIIFYQASVKSVHLNIMNRKDRITDKATAIKAFRISIPVAVEQLAFTGALVAVTKIIAPLGPVALAANSFAVTAESLCYMPGYGIQEAATALTGQSIGAKRHDLAKKFSWITVAMGMTVMSCMGILMYFICPAVFRMLTPVNEIQELSIKILRLELVAEPFYGAAIVCAGALRGAGDTFVPGIMNLISIWIVRLGLSLLLVSGYGLYGIWIAMTVELCFRGMIFLIRLKTTKSISGRLCP